MTRLAISFLLLFFASATAQSPAVLQIDLDDIVHPVSADYVRAGLNHARETGARAVIIRIDTPGGLMDSMREIVEAVLNSPVPVITWVGPSGARAASAGFFILMAGDVAVMAPGTNTGAAHPVSITGSQIPPVMEQKIVSDAAAYLRSYTATRGRNVEEAEKAVTESKSFTPEEALSQMLIDAVIADVPGILRRYDGASVRRFNGETARLDLGGAAIEVFEMSTRQQLLSRVLNPNIALILGLIGLIGLYIEITNPGLILPGVVGGISLILALFAFNVLPINWTGAALIVLAIVLFVLEATVTSHGILAVGGIVAMIAGGLMLVQGPIPQLRIQLGTVLAVTLPVAFITIFLVRLVMLSHRRKSVAGEEGMIGTVGVAKSDINPNGGSVFVHGELWNAFSSVPISEGARICVAGIHGLRLEVEPVKDDAVTRS